MEEALRAYLLAGTAVAAACANRVHWVLRPQGQPLPGLVLTRITGIRQYSHAAPVNLVQSRVQVDCYAETYLAAKTLARAVRDRLSVMTFTQGDIVFQGVFLDSERDLSEFVGATSVITHRVSLDFTIWHEEN